MIEKKYWFRDTFTNVPLVTEHDGLLFPKTDWGISEILKFAY